MNVLPIGEARFGTTAPVVIAGGGGTGLTAALAARAAGADVVVLERHPVPLGNTSMSSGLIPGPGSALQKAAGVEDSPERMYEDIMALTAGQADPVVTRVCAEQGAPTLEWLANTFGLPLEFAPNWEALGHSRSRLHRIPGGAGDDLMRHLATVAERSGVTILTDAHATHLFAHADGHVAGARFVRPDGTREDVACRALVLATSGFGGNIDMVRRYMPEIAEAVYYGWEHNRGDAVVWGRALGAAVRHMDAYQGFPALADPHRISLHFEGIVAGGIQVNALGERFYDEADSPSPAGLQVLRQPGRVAYVIYGQAQYDVAMTRKRTKVADELGAIKHAASIDELAAKLGLPAPPLRAAIEETEHLGARGEADRFGRRFARDQRMRPPFHGIRVVAAYYHTQGGLVVDADARVLGENGVPLPNLYAGGGAACGISGPGCRGYLPGNGLLTALVLGRLAGQSAARQAT
ncbi:MAG: FAD-dependent oxidoreductase [Alphaproteobacteria bacterium]|nr:FAD-dependent oxidoreductase [Alphaproteobacteria bacterium]